MKKLHESHREMYFLLERMKTRLTLVISDLEQGYAEDAGRKVADLLHNGELDRVLRRAERVADALEVLE